MNVQGLFTKFQYETVQCTFYVDLAKNIVEVFSSRKKVLITFKSRDEAPMYFIYI
jgi:hypothetical protein